MFKINANGTLGFIILVGVCLISALDRGQTQIGFFEWHAAAVVLGGVAGSLLIALRGDNFVKMLGDWLGVITGRDGKRSKLSSISDEISGLESAWKQGRRADVLRLVDSGSSPEVRVAADALVQRFQGHRLIERFDSLRHDIQEEFLPQIEGWDMVQRLGPSFGIVGTVAGMVQLFRNMANNTGNLGGAMALALLATLYGILIGTALGGPMSTRLNQLLSEYLNTVDLLERRVSALIEEDRSK
jgi:chemotaxis protein MotA